MKQSKNVEAARRAAVEVLAVNVVNIFLKKLPVVISAVEVTDFRDDGEGVYAAEKPMDVEPEEKSAGLEAFYANLTGKCDPSLPKSAMAMAVYEELYDTTPVCREILKKLAQRVPGVDFYVEQRHDGKIAIGFDLN